ncbi:MAG: SUMF1/EgtB/PvdO family nonheme iron enzyme, partial [Proteobacteria bacterium]|nr:SUMF1/EgtB/PvdO family nonheme iron enzyme [Pseudomonadota bacterium]
MMRAVVFIVTTFMVVITATFCIAETRWAVLVGIDRYQSPQISRLKGAANDASSLAETLKGTLNFPERNVLVYTSDASGAQLPTTGNIVKALKYIVKKATEEDTFVMLFSGHGVMSGEDGYLLTYGSDLGAIEFTGLPLTNLNQLLGRIKAGHKLLLVDACRNDPESGKGDKENLLVETFARGIAVTPFTGVKVRSQVAATLFSSEEGQRAYEWPDKDRGFFSYFLEKGLKGEAADSDGSVTLGGLVKYLRREVPDEVQRVLGVDLKQVPWAKMEGNDPGSWVIHRLKGKRLAEKKKEAEAKQKELDELAKLEKEKKTARSEEQAEVARWEQNIAEMDSRIAEMKQRLGTSAERNDDSLNAMLAMIKEKEGEQKRLEAVKRKRQEAEAKRRAEIERLKAEKNVKLVAALEKDLQKYEQIMSSPYGRDRQEKAWKVLIAGYPEAARGLEVGDTEGIIFKIKYGGTTNRFAMKFVYIEPGTFMMGSPSSEPGRDDDERQHRVTLTRGFHMQTTEVTQGQWKAVMGGNPSYFKSCGDDCPVEQVSLKDVQEFIQRLNQKEDTNKYRLPTEAEWEYASRAGTETALANGRISELDCNYDVNLDAMGWYCGNADKTTHRVAQKKANRWGLYDIHG